MKQIYTARSLIADGKRTSLLATLLIGVMLLVGMNNASAFYKTLNPLPFK